MLLSLKLNKSYLLAKIQIKYSGNVNPIIVSSAWILAH